MNIEQKRLPEKYHHAMMDWQQRHFPDYDYLLKHWDQFYQTPPFSLEAKLGELKSPAVELGRHKGRDKFKAVREMDDDMVDQCKRIIRAQASTELGSVQQHRESLHKAQEERLQFDVLRIMAEEFRHGYQMVYLLAGDDWGAKFADEAIEEILSMETGGHVLDAFNVYFDSFVDNIVFAAVIDRVGKYQLTMQSVFSYAPMARSMGPMLREEAFHLATGVGPLKQWVVLAAQDRGNVSIPMIQKHLNKWLPRGLEMFGDERGGKTNIDLGFKDLENQEAVDRYYREVKAQIVDELNYQIVKSRRGDITRDEAPELADHILRTGDPQQGFRPEEILYVPSVRFFRRRGIYAFDMADVHGDRISSILEYHRHLRHVLPEAYVVGRDFSHYLDHLQQTQSGKPVMEKDLPFFG